MEWVETMPHKSIVEGALQALDDFNDIEILLYGREEAMKPYLKRTSSFNSHSL